MRLFRAAENEVAYLKAGFLGFAGSGKTYTASLLAAGLAQRLGGRRPVAFFDTENGSDYVIPLFRRRGLDLLTVKTRAFCDLLTAVREAEAACDVLIIDSISQVWSELLEAFQRKHDISRILLHHWATIKAEWRRFTDLYVCSALHIIMCGRAAWEYGQVLDEYGHVTDLVRTGTRMRAEAEMGYEPSLLVEMERVKREDGRPGWAHRGKVLKDRTALIDGLTFDEPTFECFEPVVSALAIGGRHFVLDTARRSDLLFSAPDFSFEERRRRQKILAEEIEGLLVSAFPGASREERKARADVLEAAFGTRSWTAISELGPAALERAKGVAAHLCGVLAAAGKTPQGRDFLPWLEEERDAFLAARSQARPKDGGAAKPDGEVGAAPPGEGQFPGQ